MADIVYIYGGKPYLNLTNECPCRCDFCIRKNGDGLGSADTLWHKHTPSADEVKKAVEEFDFSPFDEVTVCGYGEPLCALDNLILACKIIKEKYKIRIRLNTNGLGDLINGKPTVKLISDYIDTISISLNAPDAEKYDAVCHSKFGLRAFDAMIEYTKECAKCIPIVKMTVVDVISKDDIEKCRIIAEELGVQYRVREYTAE